MAFLVTNKHVLAGYSRVRISFLAKDPTRNGPALGEVVPEAPRVGLPDSSSSVWPFRSPFCSLPLERSARSSTSNSDEKR